MFAFVKDLNKGLNVTECLLFCFCVSYVWLTPSIMTIVLQKVFKANFSQNFKLEIFLPGF